MAQNHRINIDVDKETKDYITNKADELLISVKELIILSVKNFNLSHRQIYELEKNSMEEQK